MPTRIALPLRPAFAFALLVTIAASTVAGAQAATAKAKPLQWGPAPGVFNKGAKMAVVSGNPMASGKYVLRLAMPDGYRIAPHFHPTNEHLRIVSGAFLVGMGDVMDLKKTKRLTQGDTATALATMHHYAAASGPTEVEVSGMGPFQLTYVNKADLPKP